MAVLRCEGPAACDEVGKLIARKRDMWSRDFTARLVGLGPLLDTLAVIRPPMQRALDRLKDLPTDIDPTNESQ